MSSVHQRRQGKPAEDAKQGKHDSALRDRLVAFLEVKDPAAAKNVDAVVEKYRNREIELFQRLEAKYGKLSEETATETQNGRPPSAEALRSSLPRWSRSIPEIVAVLIAMLCFANAAALSTFTFDDHKAIEGNFDAVVKPGQSVLFHEPLWWHDFWGNDLRDPTSHRSFRPVTVMSFRLDSALSSKPDGIDAQQMHMTNVALHICATFLVVKVVRKMIYALHSHPKKRSGVVVREVAVALGGAVFAAHAVHTEAVTSIVGRAELLSCCFGLLAVLLFEPLTEPGGDDDVIEWLGRFVLSSLLIVIAALSKDSGVVFAGICAGLGVLRAIANGMRGTRYGGVVAMLLLAVGIIGGRVVYLGALDLARSGLLRRSENPHLFMEEDTRWYFIWYLQVRNLQLLWEPYPLCVEYSFNCMPAFDNGFDDDRIPDMMAWTLGSIASIVISIVLLLRGVLKGGDGRGVSAVFLCAWMWGIASYLPVSHLLVTVGTVLAERCLYVPSIGVSMTVAGIVAAIPPRKRSLLVGVACLVLADVAINGALTVSRNEDWSSDVALFESAVKVCPDSAKLNQQLALLRFNEMKLESGASLLRRAMDADPEFCEPRYHLARYHLNSSKAGSSSIALALLRNCSTCNDAVAVDCFRLYSEAAPMAKPGWSAADRALDTAEILDEPGIQANQFRQAGLAFREDKRPCDAMAAFNKSVLVREKNSLFGPLSEEDPIVSKKEGTGKDDTLCNARFWLSKSTAECADLPHSELSAMQKQDGSLSRAALREVTYATGIDAVVKCGFDGRDGAMPQDFAEAAAFASGGDAEEIVADEPARRWLKAALQKDRHTRRDHLHRHVAALTAGAELLQRFGAVAALMRAAANPTEVQKLSKMDPDSLATASEVAGRLALLSAFLEKAALVANAGREEFEELLDPVDFFSDGIAEQWGERSKYFQQAASVLVQQAARNAARVINERHRGSHFQPKEETAVAFAAFNRAVGVGVASKFVRVSLGCELRYYRALLSYYKLAGISSETAGSPQAAKQHVAEVLKYAKTCNKADECPATAKLCESLVNQVSKAGSS